MRAPSIIVVVTLIMVLGTTWSMDPSKGGHGLSVGDVLVMSKDGKETHLRTFGGILGSGRDGNSTDGGGINGTAEMSTSTMASNSSMERTEANGK